MSGRLDGTCYTAGCIAVDGEGGGEPTRCELPVIVEEDYPYSCQPFPEIQTGPGHERTCRDAEGAVAVIAVVPALFGRWRVASGGAVRTGCTVWPPKYFQLLHKGPERREPVVDVRKDAIHGLKPRTGHRQMPYLGLGQKRRDLP